MYFELNFMNSVFNDKKTKKTFLLRYDEKYNIDSFDFLVSLFLYERQEYFKCNCKDK